MATNPIVIDGNLCVVTGIARRPTGIAKVMCRRLIGEMEWAGPRFAESSPHRGLTGRVVRVGDERYVVGELFEVIPDPPFL